jgi:hypothetical protein
MTTHDLRTVGFILGVPRTGTTLLRVMLAGHPRLFSPPEMILAPFETMAQRKARLTERFWERGGLRRALIDLRDIDVDAAKAEEASLGDKTVPEVYAHLQSLLGGRMLIDKCPHLCATPEALPRLETWFPDARYVWLVRHPGSVVRSLENMPYAEVMLQGYAPDAREVWSRGNRVIADFLEGVPNARWTPIRYEDLVEDPRPVMEEVCSTLGVPFDEATLDPYEGDRMRDGPKGARPVGDPNMASRGRIQPELATSWLEGFDPRSVGPETHAMAREMGYDLEAMARPPLARISTSLRTLLDRVTALEENIRIPSDLDAVEGRRFLMRMLAASVETYVEQEDTVRPRFFHAEGPHRKMFADCPDADYLRAPIRLDDGAVYRLWGRIPSDVLYTGVLLYGRGGRVGNSLRDVDLQANDDGQFEIRIGTEDARTDDGVWLCGEGDERAVMVRQYFTERSAHERVEVSIERLGDVPAPTTLDADRLADGLGSATRMLEAIFERTTGIHEMASNMALNRFIAVPGERLFPTPDITYHAMWYRIGDDQMMFIRGRLPRARYFGLCLYNAWLESFDYTRHRINLNHSQIRAAPDGSFEVCLAHRDPGHPNWLDTAGHNAGYVLARSLLLESDPELETEIIWEREFSR